MKEHLIKLRELQALDLEKDALRDRVELLKDKLQEHADVLGRLDGALEAQKQQLVETQTLHTNKQTELSENKQRLEEAREKFHSVTNSREYAAAEREVETFKNLVAQSEEEILQLTSAIGEAESAINENESKIEALRGDLKVEEDAVEAAEQEVVGRSDEIGARVKLLGKNIRGDVLGRYRFIRSRREGEAAIVPAVDGVCTGCFMRVPPQLYIQLQRGSTLEVCHNCQRILYYPEEGEQESNAQA